MLFGLDGFEILAAADAGGELEVLVQTTADLVGCPECGVVARPKDRRPTWVRDLPVGGRPVVICWRKRIWCCPHPLCEKTEAIEARQVGAVGQVLQYLRVAGGLAAGQQYRPGFGDVGEERGGVEGPVEQHESQERLAEVLRVERSTVVRWERGETTPQPWLRPRLSKALGLPPDVLAELLNDEAADQRDDETYVDHALVPADTPVAGS